MTAINVDALDLPRLFTPAEAAEILRCLGLSEMTECALRTRAYRRQVPFHLNGRRIRFTLADLREIVEGQAQRPHPPEPDTPDAPARAPRATRSVAHSRRSPSRTDITAQEAWRARRSVTA